MRPDKCSALRRTTLTASTRRGGQGGVAFEQLRVAEDGIERRAQFVAQAHDVPALGLAGGFRDLLGLLQLGVGALVRVDLVHQQVGLAARFLLGDAPAVLRQHEQPGGDAGDDGEDEEDSPQRRLEELLGRVVIERDLEVDQ